MNKFSSDSRFVRRGEGGFSLVELLVAVTVFTIIMSSVYMVFRAGLRAFRIQEDRNYAIENFRSSWRQLSRDLRCAFKPQPGRYVFRGGHTSGAFGGSDKVIFTSFLPPAQSMNGGLSEIEYYIDSDPGTNEDGLVRVNRGFAGIAASEQEPVIQEIAPLAKELELEYYDGKKWRQEWDSGKAPGSDLCAGNLPAVVRIKLKIYESRDSGRERTLNVEVPVYSSDLLSANTKG